MHPWLLDTCPRDALNTHDLRVHGGHPAHAHEAIMGRRQDQRKQQQTTKWCVHADDPTVFPLGKNVLEDIQFGGKRNYGYGEVHLKDT
jgi:3D (Asp-Asp-Asp) domain-containing protein